MFDANNGEQDRHDPDGFKQRHSLHKHHTRMRSKHFQFEEDPHRPFRMLKKRECCEIDEWIARRERDCWLRLFAFQVIFGSLIWSVIFR